MKLNFDFSPWISPVSGHIAFWQSFPDLNVNYTIEGDRKNRPQPSSALIDINLDIIDLRHAIDNIPLSNLPTGNLWIGNNNNEPTPYPNINLSNLPNLTQNKIWIGDENNRPIESSFSPSPSDATYLLQTTNDALPKSQSLQSLSKDGILKTVSNQLAIAIPDTDYATVDTLEKIKEECQQSASDAGASAEEAAGSATEAAGSATEATGAAAEASGSALAASGSATAAGLSAAGAAASAIAAGASAGNASSSASDASSSASDASSSASNANQSATNASNSATQAQTYLNTLLNTDLTLQGDVNGNGLLSAPIVTTFKPNPTFTGNQSMTIPVGNGSQRPTSLTAGMLRLNTGN
jgi:hypothetical protein